MGNNASLSIVLDNGNGDSDAILAKGTLYGKVVVDVKKTVPRHAVTLEFQIYEYVYLYLKLKLKSEGRATRVLHRQVKTLLKQSDDSVEPGVYELSFSFSVPGKMPASVTHRLGNEEFKVEYLLRTKAGDHRLQFERQLLALTPPIRVKPLSTSVTAGPSIEFLKVLLQKKGSVAMMLSIGCQSTFAKGEELRVAAAIRNRSPCDLTCRVALVERCYFRTDDAPFFDPLQKTIEKVLVEQDVTDMPGMIVGGDRGKVNVPLSAMEQEEVKADLVAENNWTCLKIPLSAATTYQGKLLHVSHAVVLTCDAQRRGWKRPSIEIPIKIGESEASLALKLSKATA